MRIADVKIDRKFNLRGDIVRVDGIARGNTPRSATVYYTLCVKGRPKGALNVGDQGEMNIANFAAWSEVPTRRRATTSQRRQSTKRSKA